jgi:serine/threonine protein kinase
VTRPPARPQHADDATKSLAGYDHLTEVGRGGDSVVYRAHDAAMGRDVAIKVLQTDDERAVARFRREIEITVRLGRQHPNIVNILTTGTTASGHPAIVMDYYESGSLHDRLRTHGPASPWGAPSRAASP